MGNRRKGDVWKYFRKVSQNAQGKAKVSCTFCGCTYLENATRMTTHLQKCSGYRKLHAIFTSEGDQPGPSNYIAEQEALGYPNSFPNDMIRHHFVEPMNQQPPQQDSEARELLARAIFACGLPLDIVEEPHWRSVFKCLDPNFLLPSPSQLETGYLEAEYCNLKAKIDKKVYDCPCLGIICESVKNEDFLNIFVTTPKCYFHKHYPKPSNECLKEDAISILNSLFHNLGNEKVVSIVTDKSSGLLESIKYIEEKYNHIAVYQCLQEAVQDLLNQLFQDPENVQNVWKRLEELKLLLKDITKDDSHVSSHIMHFIFSSRSYDMPILSYILSSKSVVIEFLLTKGSEASPEMIKKYTCEEEFWIYAEKLYQLVEPIANTLNDLDSKPPPPISHVVQIVKGFQSHFETRMSDPHYSTTEKASLHETFKRFKDLLLHPIHLAADFLDPQSKGTTLSLNEQMMATEYIYRLSVFSKDINDEDLLVDLANYKACDELWGKEYIWKAVHKLHPVSWWNGFCSNTNLSKIAVRIFNLPATIHNDKSVFYSYETYTSHSSPASQRVSSKVKEMLAYVSKNLKFMKDEIVEIPHENHSPHQRVPNRSAPPSGDSLVCVPKTEKEQPHFEGDHYDGYKYI